MDFLSAAYPWIKALHIVSVISWMAGLFYLPRLFVYHSERASPDSELSATLKVMEERLLTVIMRPAMIASWSFGLLLAVTPGVVDWGSLWAWLKAVGIVGMTVFHIHLATARKGFSADRDMGTGRHWRMMNEVPTLLMLLIVFMVVVKPF